MGTFNIAKTGASRIFVAEGGASAQNVPEFQAYLVLGSVSQSLGDIESIKVPSAQTYNTYEEIDEIIGDEERVESSLSGRYPRNARWNAYNWARKRCELAIHVHFGECTNPKSFNDYNKALIFEGARLTNIDIDEVGSLDENAVVNGSVDFSASSWYEVIPLTFTERAQSLITNEITAVWTVGQELCSDCGETLKLFAATLGAGGSPSTPPDVLYSLDKGVTWYAHDVDTMAAGEDVSGGAVVGDYVVVVSNDTNSMHYADNSDMDGVSDPSFTEVSTGFVTGAEPNAIWSVGRTGFIAADGGYVYKTTDPTTEVTALEEGNATTDNLLAIHALDDDVIGACGENGAVLLALDGASFAAKTRPAGAGIHLNTIWLRSETEIYVGANNGNLYVTYDGGTTWATLGFGGSGAGAVHSIVFSTPSVGWLSHANATPRGRLLKTVGGGAAGTWYEVPRNSQITANDRLNQIAAVWGDPNIVLAGGLADDASDGFLIAGSIS